MFGRIIIFIALVGLVMSAPVDLNEQQEWEDFKIRFNKSYSPEEDNQRFQIFRNNMQHIQEHNVKFARGEVSYTQGINEFADLTPEEFRSTRLGFRGLGLGGK